MVMWMYGGELDLVIPSVVKVDVEATTTTTTPSIQNSIKCLKGVCMYQPPTPQYNSESKFDKKKSVTFKILENHTFNKGFFLRSGFKKISLETKLNIKQTMLVERAKRNQRLYFRQKATPMGGQMNDSIDTDGRTNKWLDVQCICSDHCNKKRRRMWHFGFWNRGFKDFF